MTIHEDFAFALPDGMSDNVGALMEPLSVAIWACRKAAVTAGDRVLVTGAGPIGLLTMQVAGAFGATDVAISDVNEQRLEAARRMGATRVLRAGHDAPGEIDALIECSGHPTALRTGIEALACTSRPTRVLAFVMAGSSSAIVERRAGATAAATTSPHDRRGGPAPSTSQAGQTSLHMV